MRTLPTVLVQELTKDIFAIRHLVVLDLTNSIYRWVDGTDAIYYDSHWYLPKGIMFDSADVSITGQVDAISIELQNVDKSISNLVLSEDIRESPCTIYRVCLDSNLAVIGAASIMFQGYVDQMSIDRGKARIDLFSHMIKWKRIIPRRQHTPTCPWAFKQTECGYNGEILRKPTSDYYAGFNRSHWTTNYKCIDDMEDDLCAGGTVTESGNGGATYDGNKAFDRNNATFWQSDNTAPPHWIRYQFNTAKIIRKYKITKQANGYSPINFDLEASNDGNNWAPIDQRTAISWNTETSKSFDFKNSNSYTYYRLYVRRNTGDANITQIQELEFHGYKNGYQDEDYTSWAGNTEAADLFGFTKVSMANDLNGINVTVRTRAKQGTSSGRYLYGILGIGDQSFSSTGIYPGTSFNQLDFVFSTNPFTGNNWRYNEFQPAPRTTSNGNAVADTEYSASYNAGMAFDNNTATYWQSTTAALPHWVYYQHPEAKTIVWYKIMGTGTTNYSPKNWQVQGSNDGNNWSNLDSQNNMTWAANEAKAFKIISPASYSYYRLYVTAVGSGNNVAIREFYLYDVAWLQYFGYYTPANANNYSISISDLRLRITNSINNVECDLTKTRCKLLNNNNNFGGFSYISELQQKEFWWGSKQKIWGGKI